MGTDAPGLSDPTIGKCHWDGLYRFTLDTRQTEEIARRGDLVPPEHCKSVRLSELLSVSEDGRTLYCKAALQRERPIAYYLAELSVADRRVATISRLEAVFA